MIQVGDTVKLLTGLTTSTCTFAVGFKGKVVAQAIWTVDDKWWVDWHPHR